MPTTVTSTIKSAGGDFSSLTAWEAAKQADIAAADQIQQAECYSFNDTNPFTIDGWTTDATRYIRMYAASGERHDGTPGTGFRLDSSGFTVGLTVNEDFVRGEGISFRMGSNNQGFLRTSNNASVRDLRFSHCLFGQASNFAHVVLDPGASSVVRLWNCIFDCRTPVPALQLSSGTLYCYNNTAAYSGGAASGGFSILFQRSGGTFVAKNNVADGRNLSSHTCYSGTFDAASTNNLATDTTAPGSNAKNSKAPVYVNGASGNFKLDPNDADCRNQGADLSADANLIVADDIIGTVRPVGSAFDIGASEAPLPVLPVVTVGYLPAFDKRTWF